jgi:single-stranded DNA-binding protein
MPSFQKVIILGHLVKDPEERTFAGGSVISLSIPTDDGYMKDKEWVSDTNWHNISVFSSFTSMYEACLKLKKGDLIYVEGVYQFQKGKDNKIYPKLKPSRLYNLSSNQKGSTQKKEPLQAQETSYQDLF